MKARLLSLLPPSQQGCQHSLSIVMSTFLSTLETLGMEHRALVNELEDTFPPITPSPEDTIEKIMYRSGQRSVVEWLLNRLENNHG
jgi:hypothetical protein